MTFSDLTEAQAFELDKYPRAYLRPGYKMKEARADYCTLLLKELPHRGGYLDVGCGRGEMLLAAHFLGFEPCRGTEVVPELVNNTHVDVALAWDLPHEANSFNVVSLLDVIEHILPGDAEATCRELERVALKTVFVAPNHLSSINRDTGEELHVNRRPYDEWDRFFRNVFSGEVHRLTPPSPKITPAWRIDL